MIQVVCKQCTATAYVTDGGDVHEALVCACCPQDHHHGQAAAHQDECSASNHPGVPCWQGPASGAKPDGCTVCRPVVVRLNAPMRLGGG